MARFTEVADDHAAVGDRELRDGIVERVDRHTILVGDPDTVFPL